MPKETSTQTRSLKKEELAEAKKQLNKTYEYVGGNFEALLIIQNNNLLAQLKEMNYYLYKLAGEPDYKVEE